VGHLVDNTEISLSNVNPRSLTAFSKLLLLFLVTLTTCNKVWCADVLKPQASGLEWLKDMRHAAISLNYQGVVAYIKDQQVDSFRLYHSFREGKETERLVSMNSPLREVVRSEGTISRYTNQGQQVAVETKVSNGSILLDLPDDPILLTKHYRINLRGQEFVAGQLAQVIALEPYDEYRYTRLIWVGTDSKLPLKFDVLNDDGVSVEQMVFTSISTETEIDQKDLQPSVHSESAVANVSHRAQKPLESLNWTLSDVPEGFQIASYVLLKRPPLDIPVEHILLSDGFSSVSIYIEKRGGAKAGNARNIGAINVDTRLSNGFLLTVMGEVPLKTVKQIAKGLRYKQNHGS
jgi:sigma-E factor negative regulatory protein RseB